MCAALDAGVLPDPALRGSIPALRAALVAALPDVGDDPGTVDAPRWAATTLSNRTWAGKRGHEPHMPAQVARVGGARRADDDVDEPLAAATRWGLPRVSVPGRVAHAAGCAAMTAALLPLADVDLGVTPVTAAAFAAAATALLPRIGFVLAAVALSAVLAAGHARGWRSSPGPRRFP